MKRSAPEAEAFDYDIRNESVIAWLKRKIKDTRRECESELGNKSPTGIVNNFCQNLHQQLLELPSPPVFTMYGPSGSGKSLLFNGLMHLMEISNERYRKNRDTIFRGDVVRSDAFENLEGVLESERAIIQEDDVVAFPYSKWWKEFRRINHDDESFTKLSQINNELNLKLETGDNFEPFILPSGDAGVAAGRTTHFPFKRKYGTIVHVAVSFFKQEEIIDHMGDVDLHEAKDGLAFQRLLRLFNLQDCKATEAGTREKLERERSKVGEERLKAMNPVVKDKLGRVKLFYGGDKVGKYQPVLYRFDRFCARQIMKEYSEDNLLRYFVKEIVVYLPDPSSQNMIFYDSPGCSDRDQLLEDGLKDAVASADVLLFLNQQVSPTTQSVEMTTLRNIGCHFFERHGGNETTTFTWASAREEKRPNSDLKKVKDRQSTLKKLMVVYENDFETVNNGKDLRDFGPRERSFWCNLQFFAFCKLFLDRTTAESLINGGSGSPLLSEDEYIEFMGALGGARLFGLLFHPKQLEDQHNLVGEMIARLAEFEKNLDQPESAKEEMSPSTKEGTMPSELDMSNFRRIYEAMDKEEFDKSLRVEIKALANKMEKDISRLFFEQLSESLLGKFTGFANRFNEDNFNAFFEELRSRKAKDADCVNIFMGLFQVENDFDQQKYMRDLIEKSGKDAVASAFDTFFEGLSKKVAGLFCEDLPEIMKDNFGKFLLNHFTCLGNKQPPQRNRKQNSVKESCINAFNDMWKNARTKLVPSAKLIIRDLVTTLSDSFRSAANLEKKGQRARENKVDKRDFERVIDGYLNMVDFDPAVAKNLSNIEKHLAQSEIHRCFNGRRNVVWNWLFKVSNCNALNDNNIDDSCPFIWVKDVLKGLTGNVDVSEESAGLPKPALEQKHQTPSEDNVEALKNCLSKLKSQFERMHKYLESEAGDYRKIREGLPYYNYGGMDTFRLLLNKIAKHTTHDNVVSNLLQSTSSANIVSSSSNSQTQGPGKSSKRRKSTIGNYGCSSSGAQKPRKAKGSNGRLTAEQQAAEDIVCSSNDAQNKDVETGAKAQSPDTHVNIDMMKLRGYYNDDEPEIQGGTSA